MRTDDTKSPTIKYNVKRTSGALCYLWSFIFGTKHTYRGRCRQDLIFFGDKYGGAHVFTFNL